MATAAKKLFRGAASTTSTSLYTVPASTKTIVTDIVICNTDSSSATFSIELAGVSITSTTTIAANSIATFSMKQVMDAAEEITGDASAATISFHISGVEIS